MWDVLIVGAGPAGAVAATVLARRGVQVHLVDRASFPRDKLCGDTVNPGTVRLLTRLGMSTALEARGLPVAGMVITGPRGASIVAPYPNGVQGRSLVRRDLDWALVQRAIAAGASFEPGVAIHRPVLGEQEASGVCGVVARGGRIIRARVVIAADGRRSTLAFGLGLARHPVSPRRWAIGAYFENVGRSAGSIPLCEMHLRSGRYIGIAPVPGGLTNVCLVKQWESPGAQRSTVRLKDSAELLRRELASDPMLAERFEAARLVMMPSVLGPLAVELSGECPDGLLLAGDAGGFIDPMTGDGLRFAVRGGELAAGAALHALEHGWAGVHAGLARTLRREFAAKRRFNRTLRALVGSSAGVHIGELAASVAPFVLRAVVRHAGDCSADVQ